MSTPSRPPQPRPATPPPRSPPPAAKPVPSPAPKVIAPRGEPEDPVKAAIVEVLRTLNQAERYTDDKEKGLELDEIKQQTAEHWSFQKAGVQLTTILNLLSSNRMVDFVQGTTRSWTRDRDFGPHFRINGNGMMYLKEYIDTTQRVHGTARV